MTLDEFAKSDKTLLIAPAGHGKTYTIAKCIGMSNAGERQLVLTHTHAGISSIKQKIAKLGIISSNCEIETITGFAQRIVCSFYGLSRLNHHQDEKGYFEEVLTKCKELVMKSPIQRILNQSYHGLYVDEYQDCSLSQHKLICLIAQCIPTRLLGDPLQGIYDFDGQKVNFYHDLKDFSIIDDILTKPQRWLVNGNTKALGEKIKSIRDKLLTEKNNFPLCNDNNAHFYVQEWKDGHDAKYYSQVGKMLRGILSESVLVIVPTYFDSQRMHGNISDRAMLRKQMGLDHDYQLLEAIDDKSFYSIAHKIDETIISIGKSRRKIKKVYEILLKFQINKKDIDIWIDSTNNRVKKRNKDNRHFSDLLNDYVNSFLAYPNIQGFLKIVSFFHKEQKYQSKRPELFYQLYKAMTLSASNEKSVYENMCQLKNRIRMQGRKVEGRYIGTTLLTKGLEFDVVVILNADFFTDKRNFYVAISRACKDLYLITQSTQLHLNE